MSGAVSVSAVIKNERQSSWIALASRSRASILGELLTLTSDSFSARSFHACEYFCVTGHCGPLLTDTAVTLANKDKSA